MMSSLTSKVIKMAFKLKGVKKAFKTNHPNIHYMRRRNLKFSQSEQKHFNFKVHLLNSRKIFYRNTGSSVLAIWLHGGAYALGPFKPHLKSLASICDELAIDGALPDYPKAPEFTYKENLDFLIEFYKEIISKYDSFFIIGDSAGGGLALCFSLLLKDKGLNLPRSIYTFSPWLDLSGSVDCSQFEKADPFLAKQGLEVFAKLYAQDDLDSPYVSAFYGEFKNLKSKIFIYSGTHEILHPTALEFHKKNPHCELRVFEEMIHVWPLMPIPEAKSVFREVIVSIQECILGK